MKLPLSRKRSRFALAPAPLRDVQTAGSDAWRLTAETGVFDLLHPQGVPQGWFEMEFAVAEENLVGRFHSRLLIESDGSQTTAHLPIDRKGRVKALVRVPRDRARLHLEMSAAAAFQLADIRMRRLSAIEVAARLGMPLLLRRLAQPEDIPVAFVKFVRTLLNGGPSAVLHHLFRHRQARERRAPIAYGQWRQQFAVLSDADRAAIRARIASLPAAPVFSVLLPVFETPEPLLRRAIESVRAQLYPHWELCIADDASRAPHVRLILEEALNSDSRIKVVYRELNGHISAASNSALALASGTHVALLDHDDELAEHALYLMAEEIAAHPEAELIYSDEDKIDESGRHFDPHFKPDWNPDLLRSQNYIAHLCVLRADKVRSAGGFREGFEGSQDYDLFLRAAAKAKDIRHLPFVLYHWRAVSGSTARATHEKSYAAEAGIKALRDALPDAAVEPGPFPTTYRVRWPLPNPPPLASLIIPTRDGRALLETCVETLLSRTAYPNLELLVVDNQSRKRDALRYFARLEARGAARVLRYERSFNFSAINNFAVREARGTVVGLLNNDLEIIDPEWLSEMVSHALRPEIGAVGARLLYPDRTLQHAGVILGLGGVAGHSHKFQPPDAPGYFSRARLVQNLSAVTAACLVMRRDVYLQVGGFDEELAVAFNDIDFCLRLRKSGYRNLWTPHATLIHHESKSRGQENTAAKRARFAGEVRRMQQRWGEELLQDPAYNPNLTLEAEDFSLAWPPRVRPPWKA